MSTAESKPTRASVLFVDDEQGILRALQRSFRGASFEVRTAMGAEEALRTRIEHLLIVHAALRAQGMVELVGNFGSLPAVLLVYGKLMRAMEEGRALAEIATIVEWDIGLTARILQIVNSALYGRSGIGSAERAITLLGLETVRGVILMSSLVEPSSGKTREKEELDRVAAVTSSINALR